MRYKSKRSNGFMLLFACLSLISTICFSLLLARLMPATVYAQNIQTTELITTRSALKMAIDNAENGDVIEIGNIDFFDSPQNPGEVMPILISKSLTIKSGLNGKAMFKGFFVVRGGSLQNEKITVNFSDIDFVGTNNPRDMNLSDGDSFNDNFSHPLVSSMPQNEGVLFNGGFTDSEFQNCTFQGYASGYGAVSAKYTDNNIKDILSLKMFDCAFTNNVGKVGAGIYLYCLDNNIRFIAQDCRFSENIAAQGGGLFGHCADITLKNCEFSDMRYVAFAETVSDGNELKGGGAVCALQSKAKIINAKILDNSNPYGGGLYLAGTAATLDGCVIAGNSSDYGGGWYSSNNENQPVVIINSSIHLNSATETGGGIYIRERDELTKGRTAFLLCSLGLNTSRNAETANIATEGDPQICKVGCLIINNAASYTPPSPDNDYNAEGTVAHLTEAGFLAESFSVQAEEEQLISKSDAEARVPLNRLSVYASNRFAYGMKEYKIGFYGVKDTLVSFDCLDNNLTVKYGEVISLPSPEKNGYRFLGWYTAKKGAGDKIATDTVFAYGQDMALYARFERIFPDWGIFLIVFGATLCIGVSAAIIIYKRRRVMLSAENVGNCKIDEQVATDLQKIEPNIPMLIEKYKLTPREAELIPYLLQGETLRQISGEIHVSYDTVRFHCKNLYKKMKVTNRIELVNLCK